ncbi:MAG: DUF3298 and DUF4163 domain-containing protein [Lachnospiraceae bacterium]|nr:DUF3298 and DUF4163 domain-containing protein [Lachnospiraceae bacterium]MDE7200464.1 DUF3298 and DUF4163 domain-containing protein [Lachnospiraceae bacterium]
MKQKNILFLFIVMILLCLCTACAEKILSSDGIKEEVQTDLFLNAQTNEVQTNDIQTNEVQTNDIQTNDIQTNEVQTNDIPTEEISDSTSGTFSIEHTARISSVSFDFYTEEQSTKIGDDTILCTRKCVYPVVTIEENQNAAEKINADIQERVASFHADTFVPDIAKEDYQVISANYSEFHFSGYSDELIFTATRADRNVISFLVTSQYYAGGAHGMDTYIGLNYDTHTGELIDFADLSENVDVFGQDTLAFIQGLASTAAYRGIMWGDDWHELQEVLYQDERWYLSTSGIVFFSNPYELGAFFAGKIEFTVPYSDLEEMGFKEKYNYEGTMTIRLQTEEVCALDLNGDGQDEEIQFYIDEMGSANTDVHFIVDGTDYAVEHEELSKQFSDDDYIFCWTECYLYDMDPTDDMTEIAFQMNYTSWEDDIVTPYTFLYRYEGSGILTYLGRIEGTITDPTAVFYTGGQKD